MGVIVTNKNSHQKIAFTKQREKIKEKNSGF